jgi:hypothetical protein
LSLEKYLVVCEVKTTLKAELEILE